MLRTPTTSARVVILGLAAALLSSACGKDEVLKLEEPVEVTDDTAPMPTAGGGGGDGFGEPSPGDDEPGGTGNPPPAPPSAPGVIGKACEKDRDCGGGSTCMLSASDDFLGGGPPNGYCTADCSDDTFDCGTIDPDSTCIAVGDADAAFCMANCAIGTPAQGVIKCQDRLDLGCAPVGDQGICLPVCRNDEDCGGDRACDLSTGVCVDEAPAAGAPIGADCKGDEECATGVCLLIDDTRGYCSGTCNLFATVVADDPVTCGASSKGVVAPGQPLCIIPAFADAGFGDRGYCGIRCNCDDDCGFEGAVCEQLLDDPKAALELVGTVGFCLNGEVPAGETPPAGIACTGTAADGGAADGGVPDAG